MHLKWREMQQFWQVQIGYFFLTGSEHIKQLKEESALLAFYINLGLSK